MRKFYSIYFLFFILIFLVSCNTTKNKLKVSFNSMGGSKVKDIFVKKGSLITNPKVSRVGYELDGWYISPTSGDILEKKWSFTDNKVEDNISLYAKWNLSTYLIKYELNGGETVLNPTTYTIETSDFILSSPIKEGFTFAGWFDNAIFTGNKIDCINKGSSGEKKLYAKWIPNTYNINYFIIGSEFNITLSPDEIITSVELGYNYSAALTSNGRVFIWGSNSSGQLGYDKNLSRTQYPIDITDSFSLDDNEKIVKIALGYLHSAAITSSGRIFMWGDNLQRQLGTIYIDYSSVPIDITSRFQLKSGETIESVELGGFHSAAITSLGRLFLWGDNHYGQLGIGETTIYSSVPCDITKSIKLNPYEEIADFSLGMYHSAVLTSYGRLFMWGSNQYGQTGDSLDEINPIPESITSKFQTSKNEKIISIELGQYHSAALTSFGNIYVWGSNSSHQLGEGIDYKCDTPTNITNQFSLNNDEDKIISINLGGHHSTVLTSSGKLFLWGFCWHDKTSSGLNVEILINHPVNILDKFSLNSDERIIDVDLGTKHSSVLTSQGRIFTWGDNQFGQLGYYTVDNFTKDITPKLTGFNQFYFEKQISNKCQANISPFVPIKAGNGFSGWYMDKELTIPFNLTSMPANDINLYGKWIKE